MKGEKIRAKDEVRTKDETEHGPGWRIWNYESGVAICELCVLREQSLDSSCPLLLGCSPSELVDLPIEAPRPD